MSAIVRIDNQSFQETPEACFPKIQPSKVFQKASEALNQDQGVNTYNLKHIFKDKKELQEEFVKFFTTIFYVLDEKKVFQKLEDLFAKNINSDQEIFKELQANISSIQKRFPIFHQINSLFVLKKGTQAQIKELLEPFNPNAFTNFLEYFFKRDATTISKATGMHFKTAISVCDLPEEKHVHFFQHIANRLGTMIKERIEAGVLFVYPYTKLVSLNEPQCRHPTKQPELTHREIPSQEVPGNSVDIISCLGGLHHVPQEKVEVFVNSLHRTLRPGGVFLLRDHDAGHADCKAMAAAAHTFVNIYNGATLEEESKEVREFNSLRAWTIFLENHGFTRITTKKLVLEGDPTQNAMTAFVKTPGTVKELREAAKYRNDCFRPKVGTYSTWVEWGNVRYSKQYAEFVQHNHEYAFDYMGYMSQHWKLFYHYVKEAMQDKQVGLKQVLFAEDTSMNLMMMNLFVLFSATVQCCASTLINLPKMALARLRLGAQWREVMDLTIYPESKHAKLSELEKFQAEAAKEYCEFIDHTPFYMFDYVKKIKQLWKRVWESQESFGIQVANYAGGAFTTMSYLSYALISATIRKIFPPVKEPKPHTVSMIIRDPNDELSHVIDRWNEARKNDKENIEIIYETKDKHKLVLIPRYKSFQKICSYLAEEPSLEILEIGSQKEISIDVIAERKKEPIQVQDARVIYQMENFLEKDKKYVTYQVNVAALKHFHAVVGSKNIEHIHD